MRFIPQKEIISTVKELYLKANTILPSRVEASLRQAREREKGRARKILDILLENARIAREEKIPLCQDTGMAVVFLNIGDRVQLKGRIEAAVNQGIREAVEEGYLRASTVDDPLGKRANRGDNTPGIVHVSLEEGEQLEITVMAKGFGSENASLLYHLSPHAGWKGLQEAVLQAVREKGINACPPLFIGIGAGGTAEEALKLSKLALLNESPLTEKEEEILAAVNQLGIGPGGAGGEFTALRVKVLQYPTHIAGLPVGISLNCHALRYASKVI